MGAVECGHMPRTEKNDRTVPEQSQFQDYFSNYGMVWYGI